ncbi:hypothetical protein LXL04_007234 [Taraxacum kok-saghyz]
MMNVMLISSTGLPHAMWEEDILSTNYHLNKVPRKKTDKTPYELWSGRKPSYKYIRVWGCLAKVVTHALNVVKIPKTVDCIFIACGAIWPYFIPTIKYRAYLNRVRLNSRILYPQSNTEHFKQIESHTVPNMVQEKKIVLMKIHHINEMFDYMISFVLIVVFASCGHDLLWNTTNIKCFVPQQLYNGLFENQGLVSRTVKHPGNRGCSGSIQGVIGKKLAMLRWINSAVVNKPSKKSAIEGAVIDTNSRWLISLELEKELY